MTTSKEEVIAAVDSMYGDTRVSPQTTLDNLNEIKEHIEVLIDGLEVTMQDEE